MSLLLALALGALPASAWARPAAADDPPVIRVSAIPDENPTELLRVYGPLTSYLERELARPVRFTPVLDYPAAVEGFVARRLELVWYGGLTSVQAERRSGGNLRRLVMREEDGAFRSVFVARARSGIAGLADLRGRTFAFGSPASTSGHLMPRHFLLRAGLVPERDLGRVAYSGAHDATVVWVQSGKVDAGAVSAVVWEKLLAEGRVDRARIQAIHTTAPYVDYVWAARADLSEALRERLAAALLRLDPAVPEHRRLLALHRATRYVRAPEGAWQTIAEVGLAAGLLR